MGGGGFSMEPANLLLDRYALDSTGKPEPKVCFLPTASGDSEGYIDRFYTAFSTLPCRPCHLSLSDSPPDLTEFVKECDVIYVGGGNTRNMLTTWRSFNLDSMLHEAWKNGVVLCGLSAGAICWFDQGHTDSDGDLSVMDCLGFLSGSCTPHYDGEPERRLSFHTLIQQHRLSPGYAIDDGVALHFIDDALAYVVSSRPTAQAFYISTEGDSVVECPLDTHFLGHTNTVEQGAAVNP